MKEIDANQNAWGKISREHYYIFKSRLREGTHTLNQHIKRDLGDISGKDIIHLQCNTGADTIALSQLGAAHVTGVDLVPENIFYARKLASDLGITNVDFIESDIMTLSQKYSREHDIVFTSEGVLGWLPDLDIWAGTIRGLLKDTGFLYVFDSHPFFMMFNEEKLDKEIFEIKYPYFNKGPDVGTTIGGYATEEKGGVEVYFWMHTLSYIINSLTGAGLHIEYFNEFAENFFDSCNMRQIAGKGLFVYDYNNDKYPMSYSLKASVYRRA